MIEESGYISLIDSDPEGPKTYGSYGFGSGFGSATPLGIVIQQ
jgi:hypothetical protein